MEITTGNARVHRLCALLWKGVVRNEIPIRRWQFKCANFFCSFSSGASTALCDGKVFKNTKVGLTIGDGV